MKKVLNHIQVLLKADLQKVVNVPLIKNSQIIRDIFK